jgi:hypothetical protein
MKLNASFAALVLASSLSAQNADFNVSVTPFPAVGMMLNTQLVGPPSCAFTTYIYFGNPFVDPLDLFLLMPLWSGTTNAVGAANLMLPIQIPNLVLPEINGAAIFTPVAGPAVATEIVAMALAAGAPAPCVPHGAMTYDPELCVLDLSAKVCPGDVVTVSVNGVVIATVTAGASGAVGIVATHCLAAGETATAEVNGAPFLGGIRR